MARYEFLLTRSDDLVLLGVVLDGVDEAAGGFVAGSSATVTVTFPPQALQEQRVPSTSPYQAGTVVGAWSAGPSRVRFELPAGTSVPATVEGVLAAVDGVPVSPDATRLEIPTGLFLTPVARAAGDPVTASHAAQPRRGAAVTATWQTELVAASGVDLEPQSATGDPVFGGPPTFVLEPLSAPQRAQIVVLSHPLPDGSRTVPAAERLTLGALGATLTAHGSWPSFDWKHDLALGRDRRVRVAQRGVLLPFGHAATTVEIAERVMESDGATADAIMRVSTRLFVHPVVEFPDDDSELSRRFPFDRVEILTPVLDDLDPPAWQTFAYADDATQPLKDARAAAESAAADLYAQLQAIADANAQVVGAQGLADLGDTLAQQYLSDVEAFSSLSTEIEAANAAWGPWQTAYDDLQERLRNIPPQIEGPDGPEPNPALDEIYAELRQLELDKPAPVPFEATQRLEALRLAVASGEAHVGAALAALPKDVDAVLAANGPTAQQYVQTRDVTIPALAAELAAVSQALPLSFVPTRGTVPVTVPVRARGRLGEVALAVEAVFVADLVIPPTEHTSGYRALEDPALAATLRVPPVAVAAQRVDLVRSADPLPADVQEVHRFTFATVLDGLRHRPTIAGIRVDLPALRAMVPPGADTVVDAVLSPEFVKQGAAATAVLAELRQATDDASAEAKRFVVDFTAATDRAGALVSPKFVADTVGREVGPIAGDLLAAAATGTVPDLETLFAGSKILGIDLASILPKVKDLPVPIIVQEVQAAQDIAAGRPPTVTMSWTDVAPLEKGSFLAGNARLTLTARVSSDASFVTCSLTDFGIALPSRDKPLITLRFAELAFSARQGKTPTLSVTGVKAEFGGALALLEDLQNKVDFGRAGQLVRVREGGVTASYAVTVPEASPGAFTLRNLAFRSAVDVPFDGSPVSVSVAFASKQNPFTFTVLAFGGSGYLDLLVDGRGVQRFEASLSFAAQLALNFGVASGEIHAFGGVTFRMTPNDLELTAFLRLGGSVNVLGVVTVSIELKLELTYEKATKSLVGRATLVIEVDLTVWSDSIELDSGPWVIAGGASHAVADRAAPSGPAPQAEATFEYLSDVTQNRRIGAPVEFGDDAGAAWARYRSAFAS